MRQIHEIRKLTGGRYLVVLEEGGQFPLYAGEMEESGIREGGALNDHEFNRILTELLPKRARLCAIHFLEHTDRTEHQLRRKLTGLFYLDDIVDDTVEYMKRCHYIDDVRYAVNYMEYRKRDKSLRQLEQELQLRGISGDTFQGAADQITFPDEELQIRRWLEKKHYAGEKAERGEREKMYRFLLRRGYSQSAVSRVMRETELYG